MSSTIQRCIQLCTLLTALVLSFQSQAAYQFTTVDYPNAVSTSLWGINDSGQVVGNATFSDGSDTNFIYDINKRTFTNISAPADTGLLGINGSGVLVGGVTAKHIESGIIRDKSGRYQSFSVPGWDNTEARGVNKSGLIAGFAYAKTNDDTIGFVYDPVTGHFDTFLLQTVFPSPTIAQGINAGGQVAGSVFLPANAPGTGCIDQGRYGFVRSATGAITYFFVNGGNTAARGINDSGLIAGFANGVGFVATLSGGGSCQSLTVAAGNVLSSNNPNEAGAFAQSINNGGVVSGAWQEYLGGNPSRPTSYTMHGFIATPTK